MRSTATVRAYLNVTLLYHGDAVLETEFGDSRGQFGGSEEEPGFAGCETASVHHIAEDLLPLGEATFWVGVDVGVHGLKDWWTVCLLVSGALAVGGCFTGELRSEQLAGVETAVNAG